MTRIKCEFIPSSKHFFKRHAGQQKRVCFVIEHLLPNTQTRFLKAFLRKNALQDIHDITSKFKPRATSPQMRHSKFSFDDLLCSISIILCICISKQGGRYTNVTTHTH